MQSWYQISLSATCVFTAFFSRQDSWRLDYLGRLDRTNIFVSAHHTWQCPQVGIYGDTVTSDTYSNIFIMIKY